MVRIKPGLSKPELRRAMQAINLRAAHSIPYADGESVGDALDGIINPYFSPVVSLSGGGNYELGSTVANVNLHWTVNSFQPLISQTLTDAGTIAGSLRSYDFIGVNLTSNKTYTVVANDGEGTGSNSTSVVFQQRRHWGLSASETLDNAGLLALTSQFSTVRTQIRTFHPTAEYIWFGWPLAWGDATFRVNGLMNSAWQEYTLSHTNGSGHVADYRLYRSDYLQSGANIEVQVL